MTLEQLAEKLKPMLRNPNAVTVGNGVLFVYTMERELLPFNPSELLPRNARSPHRA